MVEKSLRAVTFDHWRTVNIKGSLEFTESEVKPKLEHVKKYPRSKGF